MLMLCASTTNSKKKDSQFIVLNPTFLVLYNLITGLMVYGDRRRTTATVRPDTNLRGLLELLYYSTYVNTAQIAVLPSLT